MSEEMAKRLQFKVVGRCGASRRFEVGSPHLHRSRPRSVDASTARDRFPRLQPYSIHFNQTPSCNLKKLGSLCSDSSRLTQRITLKHVMTQHRLNCTI